MADRSGEFSPQQSNPFTALLRIIWMVAGPVATGFLVFFIAIETTGFSWHDGAVAVALLATLAVRYVDIAIFRGETSEGRPATMQDFWRYAIKLTVVIGAAWAIVHGLKLL